ncbi:hypothetical protein ACQEVU_30130 [Dactylosporangium sp. CA-139066]
MAGRGGGQPGQATARAVRRASIKTLLKQHLPHLLRAASAISSDWAVWQSRPQLDVPALQTSPAGA